MICYRNIIVIEVLSTGTKVEASDILDTYEPAVSGDVSATVISEDAQIVDSTTFVALAELQHTDPSFFGLDTEGVEVR